MGTRVVLLGLDGLDFRLIDPLSASGYLPNFAALKEDGTWGKLRSTVPPDSPSAWNSLATGLSPAKHGVFDFFQFSWNQQRARLITRRRGGKAIWEILSENGKRVIVVNIPCTYPPDRVSGLMISGFMSPLLSEKTIFPPGFYGKLNRIIPGYEIEVAEARKSHQAYIEAIEQNTRQKMRLLEYCLEKESFDFLFFVFEGPDRLQHKFWPEIISGQPRLVRYYELIDTILGSMRDHLSGDDVLMVISDHGFRPIEGFTFLNELFVEHGLLKFHKSSFVGNLVLKRYLIPLLEGMKIYGSSSALNLRVEEVLRKRIKGPMLLRMIDWEESTLVALTNTGVVYTADSMNDATLSRLRERLQELSQVDRVYTREEAFGRGPFLKEAPGLVFTDGRNDLRYELTRIERPASDRRATHAPLGIFLACGPGVKRAHRLEGAGVCDIAPTVLHLMGVPAPSGLDGVVLHDIFEEKRENEPP